MAGSKVTFLGGEESGCGAGFEGGLGGDAGSGCGVGFDVSLGFGVDAVGTGGCSLGGGVGSWVSDVGNTLGGDAGSLEGRG